MRVLVARERDRALRVYVTPGERQQIERLAAEYGMNVSTYMRTIALYPAAVIRATPAKLAALRRRNMNLV
jgi:hypothetical protein